MCLLQAIRQTAVRRGTRASTAFTLVVGPPRRRAGASARHGRARRWGVLVSQVLLYPGGRSGLDTALGGGHGHPASARVAVARSTPAHGVAVPSPTATGVTSDTVLTVDVRCQRRSCLGWAGSGAWANVFGVDERAGQRRRGPRLATPAGALPVGSRRRLSRSDGRGRSRDGPRAPRQVRRRFSERVTRFRPGNDDRSRVRSRWTAIRSAGASSATGSRYVTLPPQRSTYCASVNPAVSTCWLSPASRWASSSPVGRIPTCGRWRTRSSELQRLSQPTSPGRTDGLLENGVPDATRLPR